MLQFLISVTPEFDVTGENMIMDKLCYVKDNLVIPLYLSGKAIYKTTVYDETGKLVKEWEPCRFPSMMRFQIDGNEFLLHGCVICKMIHGYKFPEIKSKILCRGISPSTMCKGPDGTILVFDNVDKFLKQMRYCNGQFLVEKELNIPLFDSWEDFHSLCFTEKCDHVIALHYDRKYLTGFHFPSGQVAWQHRQIQSGSPSQFLTGFRSILVLPDGRVCISTHQEVFALNPVNGTFLYTLHRYHIPIFIRAVAASSNGNQQKLAICTFPMKVSVYDVPLGPPEITSFLPLQDIASDEEHREVFV